MSDSLFLGSYCEKLAYNCSNQSSVPAGPAAAPETFTPATPDHCIQALLIPCTCNLLLLDCDLALLGLSAGLVATNTRLEHPYCTCPCLLNL